MKRLMGLDIGGTKCTVLLGEFSEEGNISILDKMVYITADYPTPDKMLPQLQNGINELLKKNKLTVKDIASIGISCGGPLDSKKGVVLSPPNLPGWDDVQIVKFFEDAFSIPVALQNDANACALAEWLMGAGKGTSNMIFLTFGTGMGAGLILNGRLYSGTNDLGGEVGHIRLAKMGPVGFGKAGSFEGFCSGGGITQLAKSIVTERLKNSQKVDFCPTLSMVDEIDTKMVALAAQAGDRLAGEIIRISAEYLGQGLAILIDILNPECIVIGSVYARNENLFKPHMERIIKQEAIPAAREVCRIKPAELGDSVGEYAALGVAVYGTNNIPL
jgi:glucokinase